MYGGPCRRILREDIDTGRVKKHDRNPATQIGMHKILGKIIAHIETARTGSAETLFRQPERKRSMFVAPCLPADQYCIRPKETVESESHYLAPLMARGSVCDQHKPMTAGLKPDKGLLYSGRKMYVGGVVAVYFDKLVDSKGQPVALTGKHAESSLDPTRMIAVYKREKLFRILAGCIGKRTGENSVSGAQEIALLIERIVEIESYKRRLYHERRAFDGVEPVMKVHRSRENENM